MVRGISASSRLAEYFWLTASIDFKGHRKFFNRGGWHIFQNRTDLKDGTFARGIADVDTNLINPEKDKVGQWRTNEILKVDPAAANAILEGRFFLTKPSCLYADSDLTKILNVSQDYYGRNCRILKRGTNFIAATFSEGDEIQFYCRPSDVVIGMKGNMPDYGARHSAPRCTS
jgi:hypothetical protein